MPNCRELPTDAVSLHGGRGPAPSPRLFPIAICLFLGLSSCGGEGKSNAAFPAGVAAGVGTSGAVVLWTLVEGADSVVAEIFRDGEAASLPTEVAVAELRDGFARAEIAGLESDTRYAYRFRSGAVLSDTGSFVTAPPEQLSQSFTFAFSGDSNSLFQPFTVLGAVRADQPDFFIYLGDTIYPDDGRHPLAPAYEVTEYDAFYRENREDPFLKDLLASASVVPLWDDHEVTNDYAGQSVDPAQLHNGLSSFFRNFPLPEDPDEPLRLYRNFRWGAAAEFFLLDERQYRSAEIICTAEDGGVLLVPDAACRARLGEPGRTFLGTAQKTWLKQALQASTATFKFVVGQLPITEFAALPYDRWEGYPEERREILDFVRDSEIENVFFLATDIHSNFVTRIVDDLPEIIVGPIATDTLLDAAGWVNLPLSPDLIFSLFFPNIEFHEVDRFAYGLITVRSETDPPSVLVEIKAEGGEVLYSTEFTAAGT